MISYFWITTSIYMLVFVTYALAFIILQYTAFNVLPFPIHEAKAIKHKTATSSNKGNTISSVSSSPPQSNGASLVVASLTILPQEQLVSAVVVQLVLLISITNSMIAVS